MYKKNIIVTGGTDGIGLSLVKKLPSLAVTDIIWFLPFIENLDRLLQELLTKSAWGFSINHITNMANTIITVNIRKALS